jgi:hypothetical protein
LRPAPHFDDFEAESGIKLKFETPAIAEFIGYVVTEDGWFPDVVRRTAKFHMGRYKDHEHFKLAAQSLSASVKCCRSYSSMQAGCHALAAYYSVPEHSNAVEALFHYCLGIDSISHRVPLEKVQYVTRLV